MENAALNYQPVRDQSVNDAEIDNFESAKRQLISMKGVEGIGRGAKSNGDDAIVVYVTDQAALSRLPQTFGGYPIVGEVSGIIKAQ